MNYLDFIQSKTAKTHEIGFAVDPATLGHKLMPFQSECVARCLRWGRGLIAADCGLGKTPMQLVWAEKMHEHTGRDVLIFAPLAVAQQTQREGVKFGVPVKVCRTQADVAPGVNITNYEMIEHFDPSHFGALVLDESGILKGYGSKTRKALGQFTDCIPYRLCCTATPAPNDLIEIINHAEFLGVMQGKEIIATYFIQDGNTTHKWRLKGHAKHDFWAWVSSWAIAVRRPSDLGFENGAFTLPALNIIQHTVDGHINEGFLTPMEAQTLMERAQARRESKDERVSKAAELANATDRPFLVWCDLNSESEALHKAIPDSVEVKGSDSIDHKIDAMIGFAEGRYRCLVAKPSICGFGMNFQICADMAFVGLSDSFERYYQAVRRCWRFGQTKPVNAHIICAETEGAVVSNIERKERESSEMMEQIVHHMNRDFKLGKRNSAPVCNSKLILPPWLGGVA